MSESTNISAHTRLFCLLGDPVSHSKSPAMMNAAFAASRIDAVYLALRVGGHALETVVAALKEVGSGGVNVTAPHKQAVIPFLDGLAESAERTASVNTVVFDGGRLIGHSTDGEGLAGALEHGLGAAIGGKTLLILGAGGAARGVLPALIERKPGRIIIANRSGQKAEALAREFGGAGIISTLPLTGSEITDVIAAADIVINATALPITSGTFLDIDLSRVGPGSLVFDMNYGRTPAGGSPFSDRGVRYSDGLQMLLYQGAGSFALWTKQDPPIEVMGSALGL